MLNVVSLHNVNMCIKLLFVAIVNVSILVNIHHLKYNMILYFILRYAKEGVQLIALVGKDYGSGSSRDWAAKGPYLLVINSF